MMRLTPAVKHLLILNILVFIGTSATENKYFFDGLLALYYPLSGNFEFWQIGTHMFMHGNFTHLLFNMFALWMFGTAVERVFDQSKFITFYISCGLGAVALTFLVYFIQVYPTINALESTGFSYDLIQDLTKLNILEGNVYKGELLANKMQAVLESYSLSINQVDESSFRALFDLNVKSNGAMVGASGAIMGILAAFGMLNPNAELMLIFFPIPIKAKYFIPGIIALDLFSAVSGVSIFSPSNTAYIAHIGGALTGFLMMYFWKKNQFDKYRWN
ncbi:MAG: rhomboid family intramembrane serine protease [Bacteroidota bacterium]|nr:rhomboid family intramembrane serine protease [Bacteroidota bacterium]